MRVRRGAVEFAAEDRGAPVEDAAADDARGIGRILDHRFPNLLARKRVERDRLFMIGEIDDAVLDQSLRLLAAIVGHAVGPGRYRPFGVVAFDLRERAEAVLAVTHSIGEQVTRWLFFVLELVLGLG